MLESKASTIEHAGSQLSRSATETGADVSHRVSEILKRASEDISSLQGSPYKARVRETVESARGMVEDNAEVVKSNIRTHPLASVAMAISMGFIAGAIISLLGSRMIQESR